MRRFRKTMERRFGILWTPSNRDLFYSGSIFCLVGATTFPALSANELIAQTKDSTSVQSTTQTNGQSSSQSAPVGSTEHSAGGDSKSTSSTMPGATSDSTSAATGTTSSTTSNTTSGTVPAASSDSHSTASGTTPAATNDSAPSPIKKELKPGEMPAPPGMDAAMKLFNAKNWPGAQKEFEKFIKEGVADVNTHQNLAYCYYYQHQYTKALTQFDWVAKYAIHNLSLQRSAATTARTIRCYKAGICPATCLKATDPGWAPLAGHPGELWMKFPNASGQGGYQAWSQHHIGQLITYVNGIAQNQGVCPTCGGTGKVPVLKDGAPPPR